MPHLDEWSMMLQKFTAAEGNGKWEMEVWDTGTDTWDIRFYAYGNKTRESEDKKILSI